MKEKELRDFVRDRKVSQETMTPDQLAQLGFLKDKIGEFKDMNESEIMSELDRLKKKREVQSKVKGHDLDDFADNIKPALNREQRRKLDDLMKHLRKD